MSVQCFFKYVFQKVVDRSRSGSVGCVDRRSSSPTIAAEIERDDNGIGHLVRPQDKAIGNEKEDNALVDEYHYVMVCKR